jgi:hypothetical protein
VDPALGRGPDSGSGTTYEKEQRRDPGTQRHHLGPYMSRNLFQLLHLAILMKKTEGDVYLMRMGSLLCDAANFGLAISTGFMVQNMMILVTVPKLKDGDDVMQ